MKAAQEYGTTNLNPFPTSTSFLYHKCSNIWSSQAPCMCGIPMTSFTHPSPSPYYRTVLILYTCPSLLTPPSFLHPDMILVLASIGTLVVGSTQEQFPQAVLSGLRFFQILRMVRMDRKGGTWKLLGSVVWAHRQVRLITWQATLELDTHRPGGHTTVIENNYPLD